MAGVRKRPAELTELADRGMRPEEIALELGKPARSFWAPLPVETATRQRRIGFDVYRIDAIEHGRVLREQCAEFGFVGVYPLDASVPSSLSLCDQAAWIYRANIEAIRLCDLVMANVDDFRGPGEVDSGTASEIGFAVALGKEVWGYTTNEGTLLDRAASILSAHGAVCERGLLVEDFGLSKNLMIACSARIVASDAAACLEAIAAHYRSKDTPSGYRRAGESQIRSTG